MKKKVSAGNIILIAVLSILLLFVLWGVGSYNSIVKVRESVNNQSSNVSAQLQRRADLIPNLVNTVKGYASHESEIMNNLTESRAKLAGAATMGEKAQANSELTSAISRLLMVVENYPNLKADSQFTNLIDELSGTENRITVARKDYNETVKIYNQKIKTFPTVIFANILGVSPAEYFQADEGSLAVPQVNFG
ncbi:MAG: LemA family protein [Oscillospiraceae bacterium]|nr:LemA family protein [Oscillospiraceae bacterium]